MGKRRYINRRRVFKGERSEKKLERLKIMRLHFPNLFDKVVFVFPPPMYSMVEATLIGAREIGFPEEKLEFYEVDFEGNIIFHLTNKKLVDVEFGNRMLDWIADGCGELFKKKTARVARDIVKEQIIIPLVNKEWDEEFVISKKEKIKRLISFWRKHTRRHPFGKEIEKSEKDVKFKEEVALPKITQNYPFLLK